MKDLKNYIEESILSDIDTTLTDTDDFLDSIAEDIKIIKDNVADKSNYKKTRSRFDEVSFWRNTIDLKSYNLWKAAGIDDKYILFDHPEYKYIHVEIITFKNGEEPTEINISIPIKDYPSKWMNWWTTTITLDQTKYSKLPVIVNYISSEILNNAKNITDVLKNAKKRTNNRKY